MNQFDVLAVHQAGAAPEEHRAGGGLRAASLVALRCVGSLIVLAAAAAVALLALTSLASLTDPGRAVQIVVVLLLAVAFILLWPAAWLAAGRNPFGRRADADLETRPRRFTLARAALSLAVLTAIYMLASLPIPPRTFTDRWGAAYLAIMIVGCVYAAATVAAAHGRGRRLLMWLAALQCTSFIIVLLIPHNPGMVGPALALSYLVATTPMLCITVAALLVWSVRGRWHPT